jgi:hypothetical protein
MAGKKRRFAHIKMDLQRAKLRLNQLYHEAEKHILKYPCRLCGAKPGFSCTKPGRARTRPHVERRRVADGLPAGRYEDPK